MQTIPDSYPHQLPTSSIHRQLTPPESLPDDNNIATQRSFSDPKDDDYYFYHRGAVMTSRRSSIQSIGRVPEEDKPQPQTEQVRLPPITSLFAAVEPPPNPYPEQPPYYSPPTSYPHVPYRRQSIFTTYATQRRQTPSPPYQRVPIPPGPQNYPAQHIQPRPPPSFIPPHRGPSSFALSHRTNSASPAERYLCPECNKSFSRPSSLRIHTFSHTGEKPFQCPEPGCTKRFSVRSNMRRHMKVHTEQLSTSPTEGDTQDDGISDISATSPGQHVPIRPRQSSI